MVGFVENNYTWVGSSPKSKKVKKLNKRDIYDFGGVTIEPIELDEDWLLDFGFTKHNSIILDSYSISISDNEFEFKEISVNIEAGNQYIYLRQGGIKEPRHEDDVVTLFNGDKNGKLFVHVLQNIYSSITFKELEKRTNKNEER